MEPHLMLKIFNRSVKKHGVVYSSLIADGDSSTYYHLLNNRVYANLNIVIRKIECRQHRVRNLVTALVEIIKKATLVNSTGDKKTALIHKLHTSFPAKPNAVIHK